MSGVGGSSDENCPPSGPKSSLDGGAAGGAEPFEPHLDPGIAELDARYAMPTYARMPVEFVRGEGSSLWDRAGNHYVDLFSGVSVHNAGHCHPQIVAAIGDAASRFMGSSNIYYSEPAAKLAKRLVDSSLGGRAFLCNSGAEANECAIKLVRRHAHARGIERPEIVVLEGGFHGRTLAALAATVKLADPDKFGPFPAGFVGVARDDAAALSEAVGPDTAAVMVEPIQGEAGIYPVGDDVLGAARAACERTGALLAFDEIQTGMGRCGTLWAHEASAVRPDLITVGKAVGGGLPVGACIISPELGEGLGPGEHGSTFAGASVAAAAAIAAFDLLSDPDLLAEVRRLGEVLAEASLRIDGVEDVRHRGLMFGLALEQGIDAPRLARAALGHGVVVNAPNPETIRLLPPLTISEEDLLDGLGRLEAAIGAGRTDT